MTHTTCEHIRDLLPAYADDGLGADEAQAVRVHLRACAACRLEAARWAALDRLLTEGLTAPEPVSQAEVEAAVQRVHETRPAWQAAPVPVRFWRSWLPAAAVAAAAILLAVLGSYAPEADVARAKGALIDEAARLASDPRELAAVRPGELVAVGTEAREWPGRLALDAAYQWDAGLSLAQSLGRRVGLAPLAVCVVLLLAANLMIARRVRETPRSLQGG